MTAFPILDLGPLDGPVLCFGGPYSNAQATQALLDQAAQRGIPADRMICTGDVVAYGGDPAACVDMIRGAGIAVVMGNCEESLGFSAADCNCGFEPGGDCAEWSEAWFAGAAAALDGGARAWMRALPRQIQFEMAGRRFAVLHGGIDDISQYVFASTPSQTKAGMIERLDVDAIIGGHSGLAFTEMTGSGLWHNAGAIGMPANDGTPRGWFSILTPGAGAIAISLHGFEYDHLSAARAIRAVTPGLPYAETLSSGLWPNMTVLPRWERQQQGRRLAPRPVIWTSADDPIASVVAAE